MRKHSGGGRPFVSAVIVAAGSGSRMGGINKQFLELRGIPVVIRSMLAFENAPCIDEIVAVARPQEIGELKALAEEYGVSKLSVIAAGGATRQESVWKGIGAVSPRAEYAAVHDGARPFVRPEEISRCLEAAEACGGAALGVPVKDTIKRVDENGVILSTPERAGLWQAQTPQIFHLQRYRQAAELARRQGLDLTDDCQLMERAGTAVHMAMGSYENIKITTPEDIALAEGILQRREEDTD